MTWLRQHLLTVLFVTLVALQASTAAMQYIAITQLESIRFNVKWTADRGAEDIAHELGKSPLKVTVCDEDGKHCAGTSVAKVSPPVRGLGSAVTYGLLVTTER